MSSPLVKVFIYLYMVCFSCLMFANPIPTDQLFRNFEIHHAILSPDGRYLATFKSEESRTFVDLTFTATRETTVDEINSLIKAAADGEMKGVLAYTDKPLVSIDFNHDPASSTCDSVLTRVMGGKLVKVIAWYDNEWGFSNRMLDTTLALMNAS